MSDFDFQWRLLENAVFKKCSKNSFYIEKFNPFPGEQQNLLGIVPKDVCHFSKLFIFCLGCKKINPRAAREQLAG
jgi:hypothetical protein